MNDGRYTTMETAEGFLVYDRLDEQPVSEAVPYRILCDKQTDSLNRRNRVQQRVIEALIRKRREQDEQFGPMVGVASGTHLAVLGKKYGDTCSSLLEFQPRERDTENELLEMVAVGLRWLEDIEASR